MEKRKSDLIAADICFMHETGPANNQTHLLTSVRNSSLDGILAFRALREDDGQIVDFVIELIEIRTPMNAILGYADLMLDADQSDADKRNHAITIRRNGRHLMSLLNDQRLFKPFSQADESTTRQFDGTGLGLAVIAGGLRTPDK